jgi:hypothetical protein
VIALAKLRRWTKYQTAATGSAKTTHKTIRNALEEGELRGAAEGLEFATKLQGSYRNSTMVRGSGDVDILVIRTDTYHADFSRVPEHSRDFAPPINPVQAFEDHAEAVYRTLQYQYGAPNVSWGEKAIDIDSDSLPRGADVVPCLQHRKFWDNHPGNYMRGIAFWADDGTKVVNFPERHRFQGARYQEWTNGNYKPTIRLFKNLRNQLVANDQLEKEQAPSYFIECLLSNVPVSILRNDDLRERVESTVEYLESQTDEELEAFTTQHGLRDLFGANSTQWNLEDYHEFLDAVEAELLE